MVRLETQTRSISGGWIAAIGLLLVGLMIGLESIPALAIVLMDGGAALAVLAAAALAGGWVVHWLGLKDAPLAERLVLGAAVGVGLLALLVLGLGALRWLNRLTAFAAVGLIAAAGLIRLGLDLQTAGLLQPGNPKPDVPAPAHRSAAATSHAQASKPSPNTSRWLWLLACPFAALILLAATLPPGVLWSEEGNGYDVLEYHLAVPKIFWEQGAVTFLPNNVYSNFPLNSEMLSLLMMTLRGDPIESAFMAVTVNAGLAVLFAAGAWLAGTRFSPRAGIAAGILAATTPWLAYLAGIAYTETGMLALGMCALAAALPREKGSEAISDTSPATTASKKWLLTPFSAGVLAGLACGFKYTAVPLIALPVGIIVFAGGDNWPRRARSLAIYALGAGLTFSPWLIRNTVNTGNPFFPLAYSVFGDRSGTWNDELNTRWQRAHDSPLAERTNESVITRAWARTGGDFRLGAATFVLAAIGAIRRRDRWTAMLIAMLILQAAVWLLATHLLARFAVVLVLPALILAGRAFGDEGHSSAPPSAPKSAARALGKPGMELALVAVLLAGTGWNLYRFGQLYLEHTRPGGTAIAAYGHLDWFTSGQWPGTQHWAAINALPAGSRVMLVGEARTFYLRRPCDYAVVFNRQPLAEAAEQYARSADLLAWLRERGTTHLLVDFSEIGRLSNTYGLPRVLADPAFYQALIAAGLKRVDDFRFADDAPPYATLFEVPQP